VFPVAIPHAARNGACVSAFATTAPSAMPGHTCGPSSSNTASAMPVGGHTAVTCSATNAIESPSFAATK
jgi:hypothetical protein